MVSLESQQKIESYYPFKHNSSRIIASCHGALSTPVYANELLSIVSANMLEEPKLQRTR